MGLPMHHRAGRTATTHTGHSSIRQLQATDHSIATMQQADLERIAQQLTARKGQLRQGILMTKRSLGEAVHDITESVKEMKACRERMMWLETMLANLKDAIAVAKTLEEKEDFEDEVEEWEDEREEEIEHMQFLTREHNNMQEHRKMLLASLVALGRQFLQVRQRERLLVSAALRLGVVRLNRIKQVA